jgi:hypothetical protein
VLIVPGFGVSTSADLMISMVFFENSREAKERGIWA